MAQVGIQSTDWLRRETLTAYLRTVRSLTIVGRVARYEDVVSFCALQRPDIMLLDVDEDIDLAEAVAACRAARERCTDVRLVLAYSELTPQGVHAAQQAGVDALVPRSHGLGQLAAVLNRLARGVPGPVVPAGGLSVRQREILLLLASGNNTAEMAGALGISPGTVENHKRRIYAKLNATSAVQAVAQAVAFGIIDQRSGGASRAAAARNRLASRPKVDLDRQVLALVVGVGRETVDRVVATLIAHRLPVLRDNEPSSRQSADRLRWYRGPVVRVLVDPARGHWPIGAAADRKVVVVHSGPADQGVTTAALANGATAVLPIDHVPECLVPILVLVVRGYRVVDGDVSPPLAPHSNGEPWPNLTAREYDILRSIGRGHTLRQTARSLDIAVKTVENTQSHLFQKLAVHNRAEALAAAHSLGLLKPP